MKIKKEWFHAAMMWHGITPIQKGFPARNALLFNHTL